MTKMTVEFNERLSDIVTELADEQDIPKTQVVRRAVAMLKYLQDEADQGHVIKVVDKSTGAEKEIVFQTV